MAKFAHRFPGLPRVPASHGTANLHANLPDHHPRGIRREPA